MHTIMKERKAMGRIPGYDEAKNIMCEYNKEPFHIRHSTIVSGVMRWFAKKYDAENEEYWAVVGLLHDIDFELYPDEHCIKCEEIMRELELDEGLIKAVVSHGYKVAQFETPPEKYMEKVLYAIDELTGLIGAAALMRPSKSVMDMECKSVMKKFRSPSFAVGVSREVIEKGANMMGITLEELVEDTILAMRSLSDEMEI